MTPLVVVGAGGHGREMLDVVEAINRTKPTFRLIGVVDDCGDRDGLLARRDIRVLGQTASLSEIDALYAIGVGAPEQRRLVDALASSLNMRPATLMHPTVVLGTGLRIGPGFYAAAHAQVTTNVLIGRHVHLNLGATVSHDCILGDYVTLSPGVHLSGAVTIGAGVVLGVGAVVLPGVTIGDHTCVGAGAVVVDDLPPRITAVGVPAKALER